MTNIKVPIYNLDGEKIGDAALPECFTEEVRPDIIKRAVLSEESAERQPKGNYVWAGFETSARYVGRKEVYGTVKNRGIPHLPHEVLPKGRLGRVKRVPHAVKGHRAHPPKAEKKIVERINKKEYVKAFKSALGATASKEYIEGRMGFLFEHVPVVLNKEAEKISRTSDVLKLLRNLKLEGRVNEWKRRNSKGMLLVCSGEKLYKAARNIKGMEAVMVSDLRVKHLAPGTHPGRLLLITEDALNGVKDRINRLLETGLDFIKGRNTFFG